MADRTDSLSLRADRTRNHLSELMENLQEQITPAELVNQLVGFRNPNNGPGLSQTITAQVRNNPLACMLIAAGIGWLMLSDRAERNRRPHRGTRTASRRAAVKMRRGGRKKAA